MIWMIISYAESVNFWHNAGSQHTPPYQVWLQQVKHLEDVENKAISREYKALHLFT